MQLTAGHIIGRALKAYGVPYITALPGHGNWNLLDAFNDEVANVPIIQTMHERSPSGASIIFESAAHLPYPRDPSSPPATAQTFH